MQTTKYAAPLKWHHLKEVQVENNFVWAHASIDFSLQAMQRSVYLSQFNLHPQVAQHLSAGRTQKKKKEIQGKPQPAWHTWQQGLVPTLWMKDDADGEGALKLCLIPCQSELQKGLFWLSPRNWNSSLCGINAFVFEGLYECLTYKTPRKWRAAEQDLPLLSSSPIVQGLSPNTHCTFSRKLLFAQAKAPSL